MATLGASMVTLLTDNWAGAGAAPTFGFLLDYQKDLAGTEEQVLVRLPIYEEVTPINDTYSNFKFTIQLRVKTTVDEDRLKVLTDETIRILNNYAITGITRQFAKRGENTSDRKRQVFSYDVWAILEEHMSTGGTAYASPGAGDVPFPRDVSIARDLAVIRNATVGGTLGVTGDATVANLITAGNVDGVDVSTHKASLADHTDLTATAPQIEDLLMFGSANKAWTPCVFQMAANLAYVKGAVFSVANVGADDVGVSYVLPLPTNRGGLKLYVDDIKIVLNDADADDYVDMVRFAGLNTDGTFTTMVTDGTNLTAAGTNTVAFAAQDCSSYESTIVFVNMFCTGAAHLIIAAVTAGTYYAA